MSYSNVFQYAQRLIDKRNLISLFFCCLIFHSLVSLERQRTTMLAVVGDAGDKRSSRKDNYEFVLEEGLKVTAKTYYGNLRINGKS
ncbi:uncharacterized protein BDR25DRAFT_361653 [Lindgomyces ingoldianus]|uniref:Uncharacterized protein n=1 Tax=Lindgomyces ingoldianus TaxID=673940 RepID=A0ACB6QBG2_9PLEO|nr:uncharacterized protein BDR25DRAFT_361653 [Lindgomyces ingoldianus]KAF2464384.1 hypothetical protein BDR25DRAFT_361653 [Lindgomyces ingoldianus]